MTRSSGGTVRRWVTYAPSARAVRAPQTVTTRFSDGQLFMRSNAGVHARFSRAAREPSRGAPCWAPLLAATSWLDSFIGVVNFTVPHQKGTTRSDPPTTRTSARATEANAHSGGTVPNMKDWPPKNLASPRARPAAIATQPPTIRLVRQCISRRPTPGLSRGPREARTVGWSPLLGFSHLETHPMPPWQRY
jgi:hypothetical protein